MLPGSWGCTPLEPPTWTGADAIEGPLPRSFAFNSFAQDPIHSREIATRNAVPAPEIHAQQAFQWKGCDETYFSTAFLPTKDRIASNIIAWSGSTVRMC